MNPVAIYKPVVNMEEIMKPEEGYVLINNDSSNLPSDHGNGLVQNKTINYNTSEKLTEQYE